MVAAFACLFSSSMLPRAFIPSTAPSSNRNQELSVLFMIYALVSILWGPLYTLDPSFLRTIQCGHSARSRHVFVVQSRPLIRRIPDKRNSSFLEYSAHRK